MTRMEDADKVAFMDGFMKLTIFKTVPATFTVEGTIGEDGVAYDSWENIVAGIDAAGRIRGGV